MKYLENLQEIAEPLVDRPIVQPIDILEQLRHILMRALRRLEGIDSDNELTWNVVRPLFAYFANGFSRNLSEKIKLGIKTQREQGTYRGGRPSKQLDVDRLRAIRLSNPAVDWRTLTKLYNDGLPDKQQVSFTLLRRVYQKLSFNGQHATCPN